MKAIKKPSFVCCCIFYCFLLTACGGELDLENKNTNKSRSSPTITNTLDLRGTNIPILERTQIHSTIQASDQLKTGADVAGSIENSAHVKVIETTTNTTVPVELSFDHLTYQLNIKPKTAWPEGGKFKITISGVQDLSGNTLSNTFTSVFATSQDLVSNQQPLIANKQ